MGQGWPAPWSPSPCASPALAPGTPSRQSSPGTFGGPSPSSPTGSYSSNVTCWNLQHSNALRHVRNRGAGGRRKTVHEHAINAAKRPTHRHWFSIACHRPSNEQDMRLFIGGLMFLAWTPRCLYSAARSTPPVCTTRTNVHDAAASKAAPTACSSYIMKSTSKFFWQVSGLHQLLHHHNKV
jgi:hypothetical protein